MTNLFAKVIAAARAGGDHVRRSKPLQDFLAVLIGAGIGLLVISAFV